MSQTILFILSAFLLIINANAARNYRPVIGIFSLAVNDNLDSSSSGPTSHIPASYVKWLEQNQARVAVIPYNADRQTLTNLFNSVNGILFTGGGLSLNFTTQYFQNAYFLYQMAVQANQNGDHFPVWGTCQGFQLLNIMQSYDHDVLQCTYDSYNLSLALDFTADAPISKLFGNAQVANVYPYSTKSVYDYFATSESATINMHHCGISPVDFNSKPALTSFFKVLSTNKDRNGKEFVSTIEGINMPIYGTQWHSERTQFEWSIYEDLDHSLLASRAHSFVSSIFINDAQQNNHRFPDPSSELQALIYNHEIVFNFKPDVPYSDLQIYQFYY